MNLIDALQSKIPLPPSPPTAPEIAPPPTFPPEPQLPAIPAHPSPHFLQIKEDYKSRIHELEAALRSTSGHQRWRLRKHLGNLHRERSETLLGIKLSEIHPALADEYRAKLRAREDWSRLRSSTLEAYEVKKTSTLAQYQSAQQRWQSAHDDWTRQFDIPSRIAKRLRSQCTHFFHPRPVPPSPSALRLERLSVREAKLRSAEKLVKPVQKLPWRFLPPGETGMHRLVQAVRSFHRRNPDSHIDESRLTYANSLRPKSIFVGTDEFDGYFAFVFPNTTRVLLENPIEGNAAYIFRRNWQNLSKLSKTELLTGYSNQVTRVIHGGNWKARTKRLVKPTSPNRRIRKSAKHRHAHYRRSLKKANSYQTRRY